MPILSPGCHLCFWPTSYKLELPKNPSSDSINLNPQNSGKHFLPFTSWLWKNVVKDTDEHPDGRGVRGTGDHALSGHHPPNTSTCSPTWKLSEPCTSGDFYEGLWSIINCIPSPSPLSGELGTELKISSFWSWLGLCRDHPGAHAEAPHWSKRHCSLPGNSKGSRSSVPGTGVKDQCIFSLLFHTFFKEMGDLLFLGSLHSSGERGKSTGFWVCQMGGYSEGRRVTELGAPTSG